MELSEHNWQRCDAEPKPYGLRPASKYYYVHSYAVPYRERVLENDGWAVATARYGEEEFVGAIGKGMSSLHSFILKRGGRFEGSESLLDGKCLEDLKQILVVVIDGWA
jgi:glutamine amidotransferase/cyclase